MFSQEGPPGARLSKERRAGRGRYRAGFRGLGAAGGSRWRGIGPGRGGAGRGRVSVAGGAGGGRGAGRAEQSRSQSSSMERGVRVFGDPKVKWKCCWRRWAGNGACTGAEMLCTGTGNGACTGVAAGSCIRRENWAIHRSRAAARAPGRGSWGTTRRGGGVQRGGSGGMPGARRLSRGSAASGVTRRCQPGSVLLLPGAPRRDAQELPRVSGTFRVSQRRSGAGPGSPLRGHPSTRPGSLCASVGRCAGSLAGEKASTATVALVDSNKCFLLCFWFGGWFCCSVGGFV